MGWSYLDVPTPFGMAHRGGHDVAVGNTEAAFANARSIGYLHLETDVHRTSDGVLVAFHDDDLQASLGMPGSIEDYTWEELSKARLEGDHPIPLMGELLERFPDARFNIDPKQDDAVEPLIEVIREHDAVDRVCIGAFSQARIRRVQKALGPRLCTSPGPPGVLKVLAAAYLWPRWTPPYGCLQLPTRQYGITLASAGLIRRVRRLGLQVHFWTINSGDEMRRLLDLGADAIITDEVTLLKEVLTERGGGPPASP